MIEAIVVGPDDWQLWRTLRQAALGEAPHAFGSRLADWTGEGDLEARWRARLADVEHNVVLLHDGEPAGMVSGRAPADDAGEAELISLWVAPAARGTGVGDEAVRQILTWSAARYPHAPLVLSVKIGNDAARRLYERHGFVDDGPDPHDDSERRMRLVR